MQAVTRLPNKYAAVKQRVGTENEVSLGPAGWWLVRRCILIDTRTSRSSSAGYSYMSVAPTNRAFTATSTNTFE